MRDKITTISIKKLEASNILYQHDTGQIIQFVEEIQNDSLVLFENHNVQLKAEPQYVRDNYVEVPNKLLTVEGNLIVTIKLVDENSETTQRVVKIKIKKGADIDGKIPEENQKTFIQQIQETMDSAKQIAQSIRDDADKGKFKGEPGVQGIQGERGPQGIPGTDGHTPVKGIDYFTEEDKEKISNVSAEKVTEEIQVELDNKVPTTRKVAGKGLNKDVSIYDIVNALYDNTGKNPISDFEFLLMSSRTFKDTNDKINEKINRADFARDVQTVGGAFDILETTNKSNYVSAINELVSVLAQKADKNEWQLFNTYKADGETGGFEYTSASGIKAKEIMVIGRGLTFSAGANINLGFRTSKNPYSTGHHQLVFANAVGTATTYQFQGTIQRVGTDEILVAIELWAEKSVATSNVLKRQHIFKNTELFENKNIVYVSNTVSSGNKINTGTIEIYTRGRY